MYSFIKRFIYDTVILFIYNNSYCLDNNNSYTFEKSKEPFYYDVHSNYTRCALKIVLLFPIVLRIKYIMGFCRNS